MQDNMGDKSGACGEKYSLTASTGVTYHNLVYFRPVSTANSPLQQEAPYDFKPRIN